MCGFAGGLAKIGGWRAARRGRRALPGDCGFAGRLASVRCCCAERRGRRSLPGVCGFAEGEIKSFPCAAGPAMGLTPAPTRARCGCAGPFRSSKALSPLPSPSGGGCRPQGRQERENVTGPRCGNDRSRGSMRTIFPSASGRVLPPPSSASRGIGGCHLPPLGEGRDEPAAAL